MWRSENKEEFLAKNNAYVEANRESVNKSKKAYRVRHAERLKQGARQRYSANRETLRPYFLERARIWRENNREQSRLNAKRQRAIRKKAKVETVTKEQIRNLFAKQRGRCAICQCKITMDNKHIDHIQPLSKGGVHAIRNLQLTCRPCNMEKHAEDPIDFMQKLGFLL
jgi:5-methylcytosine-specific restriction endonuclease McrA